MHSSTCLCFPHSLRTEQGLHNVCRKSLNEQQRLLHGTLNACKTADAVLALVAQCNPALLNRPIVARALQCLATGGSATAWRACKQFSARQALLERPEVQHLLSLARQGTPKMKGPTLARLFRALTKLKCTNGTLFARIEGETR